MPPRMVKIKRDVLAALAARQGAITNTPTARAAFNPDPVTAGRLVSSAITTTPPAPAQYPPSWRVGLGKRSGVVAGRRGRPFATTVHRATASAASVLSPTPAPAGAPATEAAPASGGAAWQAERRAGEERRIAAEQAGHAGHDAREYVASSTAASQAARSRADTNRMLTEQQQRGALR